MGAGTPIRPVNQTVETPSPNLAPNPFRAEPLENNAGPAISAVGQGLFGIWQQQQEHQNALDAVDATGRFQGELAQLKTDVLNSGMSAKDMTTNFATSTRELSNAYVNNPAYAHIAPQLAIATRFHVNDQMQSFPAEATERVFHDLDFKFNQQTNATAARVGQMYSMIGPDGKPFNPTNPDPNNKPTFQLTADGLAALNGPTGQVAAIDKAYPPTARPTENQYYRDQLAQKLALQTGMSIANNPDQAPFIDEYIKQHGPMIPAEQQMALLSRATDTMRRPQEQLETNYGAQRAQLMQQFTQQAADGNLDMGALSLARAHQRINEDDFERIAGYAYLPEGNPDAIAQMQRQIKTAESPEELDALKAGINGQIDRNIYGRGAIGLGQQIDAQKKQFDTDIGQAKLQAYDQITRAYQTGPGVGPLGAQFYNEMAGVTGAPALTQLRANAKADFEAATYGVTDPGKIRDAMKRAITDNLPDPAVSNPHGAFGPTAKPTALPTDFPRLNPGESMSSFGARIRQYLLAHPPAPSALGPTSSAPAR